MSENPEKPTRKLWLWAKDEDGKAGWLPVYLSPDLGTVRTWEEPVHGGWLPGTEIEGNGEGAGMSEHTRLPVTKWLEERLKGGSE